MANSKKGEQIVEPVAGDPVAGGLEDLATGPATPVVAPTGPVAPVVEKSKVDAKKVEEDAKITENQNVTLFNLLGEEVAKKDYFHKGIVPPGFEGTCGKPVDREDLITVFHKVFKPEDNILFYKQNDREVYIVIIPIKYSIDIGDFNDSLDGDFQKHAISFLSEGSVNPDTLRQKLDKISSFVKYTDR